MIFDQASSMGFRSGEYYGCYAHTARAAEDEIEVDLAGAVPQFSRRPTYGAPFKLVVQLQEGSRAVLRALALRNRDQRAAESQAAATD